MALLHGIDLSRWQKALTVAAITAYAPEISFVNIALSKGAGGHPETEALRPVWSRDAWAAGLIRGGYHWLDAASSGQAQWDVCAREALATFGSMDGWFLQVDCESDATQQIAVDFLRAATRELDRPVAFYTGDWWLNPRGWLDVEYEADYLWSAPEAGRLSAVPAAGSPHWEWHGVGGWSEVHLLQWSASQKVAGVTVSSTVVRKPGVLTALCGG
jgi:hypothetical protein